MPKLNIYKFSRVLSAPFILVVIYCIYMLFTDRPDQATWIIAPIVILTLIYLFQPQIDYWWLSRNPINLDDEVVKILQAINPFYPGFNSDEKKNFDTRLMLYVEARQFIAKGTEDKKVPFDIKYALSQVPVTMNIKEKDFRLDKFERIVLYKHPFPSPRFQFLHTYETHVEDGVIILALSHAEKGLFNPAQYYNVAGHAFAEAYIKANPAKEYPAIENDFWKKNEMVSGFTEQQIITTLGFESMDPLSVMINNYFTYPDKTKELFHESWKKLDDIFKLST